jgi:hypothetical protein
VDDRFESVSAGELLESWSVYSPQWAPVSRGTEAGNGFLRLEDADPYDYAKAVRVFPEDQRVRIAFKLRLQPQADGSLEIEVVDRAGQRPVRVVFDSGTGEIRGNRGDAPAPVGSFRANEWYAVVIEVDVRSKRYSLSLNGETLIEAGALAHRDGVESVERLELRTGAYRLNTILPYEAEPLMNDGLPGSEVQSPRSEYHVDDVVIQPIASSL